jgi:hypothetical protein
LYQLAVGVPIIHHDRKTAKQDRQTARIFAPQLATLLEPPGVYHPCLHRYGSSGMHNVTISPEDVISLTGELPFQRGDTHDLL